MKKEVTRCLLLISSLTVIAHLQSCLKEADLPVVNTNEVREIKTRTAFFCGNIIDDGGAEVELRGFCWGTANNPTIDDKKRYCKGIEGTDRFECRVSGLVPNTYYHIRAFAINRTGIAYGNEVHFTTLPIDVNVITTSVSVISCTVVKAEGNIECGDVSIVLERGFCTATTEKPTINNTIHRGLQGTGKYSGWLGGLQPLTTYHVRAYAKTIVGITYGEDICFTTLNAPAVTTRVTELKRTSAVIEAKIKWDGSSNLYTDIMCIYFGTTPNPATLLYWDPWNPADAFKIIEGGFTCTLADLNPSTLYYARAYFFVSKFLAPGSFEEFDLYGDEITFTTSQ